MGGGPHGLAGVAERWEDGQGGASESRAWAHRLAVTREDDGIPPEVALDHVFPGVVLVLSQLPEGVTSEARSVWLVDEYLPKTLPGSSAALCLSLDQLQLPESSPVYVPLEDGADRRTLEIYFLDRTPDAVWSETFAGFGTAQEAAGMGEVSMAAGFLPTIPGTDRYVDEI